METAVRRDLTLVYALTVDWLRRPGALWTGAQKLAMVDEMRRARDSETLPAWVTPSSLDGFNDLGVLPPAAVDAVWRLTNHCGTMSADWLDTLLEAGIEALAYVELVAVVAVANALEAFAAGNGSPPPTIGPPVDGEPSGEVVADAEVSTHWVPTDPEFNGPNVRKALTAVPNAVSVVGRLAATQYIPLEGIFGDMSWSRGPLDRMQVEFLATTTSLLNECFY